MQLTLGLHRARRMRPADLALVDGEVRLGFAELVDRIARLAAVFRSRGLGPDGRVAILAPNGQAYVEALFAAFWAGGVAVPINSRFSAPEMLDQMRDAEPTILVVDAAFSAEAVPLIAGTASLRATLVVGEAPAPAGAVPYEAAIAAAEPAEDALRRGDDLACIFYTGGTTGRAKGVMLSHANMWANAVATAAACGFDERLVHLHSGPLFHLAAAGRVVTTAVVGGRHVVVPRFTPAIAIAAIAREGVTVATFVPTMLTMILEEPEVAGLNLSSLRLISYGASPMPETTLRRSMERFPGVSFAQSYGMTELSPVATMLTPADHAPGAPAHRLRSAGRPMMSAEVRIADADDGDLPVGEIGEILVRGPIVMQGYWRQPELTRETLRGGWMHTGDAGYLDADSYLFVTDRIKDMIITGGENVYSTEVENALHGHPAVQQCAVIGLPDPRWGERVHAVVVLKPGARTAGEELIAHCRGLIAGYKLPRSIELHEGPLPLSSVGKIHKAALRELAALRAQAAARAEVCA